MREYLLLLKRNRDYRLLWWGNVVSLLGDWFNLLASAELITDLTDSGTAISSLFLARFLPLFVVSPLAGVLADRFDRKRLMIFSDVLRAVTVFCFLFVRSSGDVWLLYVLTIVQFGLSALFTPSRAAVLTNVVSREELVTANALDSLTWSTMLAMGSFLGGVVAAFFGAQTAFVLDALTFLVSAVLVGRIAGLTKVDGAGEQTGWLDFVDGFRYLSARPFILGVSLVKAGGALVWGAINVLEISFANDIFAERFVNWRVVADAGTAVLGVIYFVSGLGTGLGPLYMRKWLGDAPRRLLLGITFGFVIVPAGILWLSAAPTLGSFLVATAVRTIGSGVVWVFSAALLAMLVPNEFRGRVFAFEFAALTLTQSISTLAAGVGQDLFGLSVRQVAALMGFLGIAIFSIWLIFYFKARGRFASDFVNEPVA